jgi:peptidoglycan hydrolase CwlO-like protein
MPTVPSLPPLDAKPFYAYVGAGNAALESLRTRVTTLPEQLKTVPSSLKAARTQLPSQVKDLQGQFAQLPVFAATLPAQVKELQATFEKRYNELATRGEKVVAELRGGKAKATATPAGKPTAAKPAPSSNTVKKPAAKKPAAATTPTVTVAEQTTTSRNGVLPTQPVQTS